MATERHWTARSTEDFVHRIAADFVFQLDQRIDDDEVKQKELAERIGISPGAVSQKLNNPGNWELDTMVRYAGALGMKVAVIAYDDDDPENTKGPIVSGIFVKCWERLGKPVDFFQLEGMKQSNHGWIVYRGDTTAETVKNKRVEDLNFLKSATTTPRERWECADIDTPNIVQPVSADGGTRIVTSHKKVAEALLKYHDIHDGIWGLFLRFGIGAANVGPSESEVHPAAIVPVLEIGLQKFDKEGPLSVDAAKVNPRSPQ